MRKEGVREDIGYEMLRIFKFKTQRQKAMVLLTFSIWYIIS